MCQLAQVSRAGFYWWSQEPQPVEEEMEVRSAIRQIAMEHRRRYGYRHISAELRQRGMQVNQVARIVREDNWLAIQPRQFVVTTKSYHKLEVHLNRARMKLTGMDQRCGVSDIIDQMNRCRSMLIPAERCAAESSAVNANLCGATPKAGEDSQQTGSAAQDAFSARLMVDHSLKALEGSSGSVDAISLAWPLLLAESVTQRDF